MSSIMQQCCSSAQHEYRLILRCKDMSSHEDHCKVQDAFSIFCICKQRGL